MFSNRMTADQIAVLEPGAEVLIETYTDSFSRSSLYFATVAKLTPKQVVVHYSAPRGTVEARFRRDDAGMIGSRRGELLDPEHPDTRRSVAAQQRQQRRQAIDSLASRWTRERENLDVLRRLHTAVGEYLDAEAAS